MVEVFKTNVPDPHQSEKMLGILVEAFPSFMINFDLDDCDKILRVEGHDICADSIIGILNANRYDCEVLV